MALFAYAQRNDLLRRRLPEAVYRWETQTSSAPVVFFLVSIPVAFVSTTAAVVVWFLFIPFQIMYLDPRRPPSPSDA